MTELLEKIFIKLGLSPYEIKAYSTLVEQGQLKAADISKLARIPQSKIYTVLELLKMKGLVEISPGFPKEYYAILPNIAADKLLKIKENKIQEMKKEINTSLKKIKNKIKKKRTSEEKIWTMFGKESFPEKGLELLKTAKKSFILCTNNFSLNPDLEKEFKNAIKRGVECKIIGIISSKNIKNAKKYKKIGFEIKHLKHNFPRFAVIDEKSIIFRLSQPERGIYTSIWVESYALSNVFTKTFKNLWKNGKNIENVIKK